jgi:ATP-binding cassette subfamily F protein uup
VALLLNASGLKKTYGAVPLFENISLNISDGDRLGLIGPNGSGKSTLLQVLAGQLKPDEGNLALRKNARLSYVAQQSEFVHGETVRDVVSRALARSATLPAEREGRLAETLGRVGFTDFEVEAAQLSGGWRKRLAIAEALVSDPELLLLDEPTNHLDLPGIEWLERLLASSAFASVVISHDRYFLENVATDVAELNRIYPDDIFRVRGRYSEFLEKKNEFLIAQAKQQEALANRVRTEIEWLRRGPKARATKAKARIDKAHELIRELNDLNTRTRAGSADIDFSATDRRTKRLIELKNVSFSIGGRQLLKNVDLTLTAGTRVGLVGPNGSGKTTMLRLLRGEWQPDSGDVVRAESLRIVYFDQNRPLDPALTLRRALAPHSDSVVYQDRTIHVASWAARFMFTNEQLNQPVDRLSGGERARVLIAKLMLEPADLLLLDEPTNWTFPLSKFWRRVYSNFAERSCWSRTTVTCLTAYQQPSGVSMVRVARRALRTTVNGKPGKRSGRLLRRKYVRWSKLRLAPPQRKRNFLILTAATLKPLRNVLPKLRKFWRPNAPC